MSRWKNSFSVAFALFPLTVAAFTPQSHDRRHDSRGVQQRDFQRLPDADHRRADLQRCAELDELYSADIQRLDYYSKPEPGSVRKDVSGELLKNIKKINLGAKFELNLFPDFQKMRERSISVVLTRQIIMNC